jgi:hypothetical protein
MRLIPRILVMSRRAEGLCAQIRAEFAAEVEHLASLAVRSLGGPVAGGAHARAPGDSCTPAPLPARSLPGSGAFRQAGMRRPCDPGRKAPPTRRATRLPQRRGTDRPSGASKRLMTTMRWLGRWLLPSAGLVLVSASCGVRLAATNPAQPPGSTARVFGVVEAGPGCPVERQDHVCKPRLLGDVRVEARLLPAGVTATTRTGADGHYSFRLAKGRYVLVAATGQVVPRCPDVLVSVTSPAPVRANINCDSGIR